MTSQWWTAPVDDDMEQINAFALFLLGKWLDSCFLSITKPIQENYLAFARVRSLLDILISGEGKLRLDESLNAAISLREVLDSILSANRRDLGYVASEGMVQRFQMAWSTFEQALELDLGRAPIFFVTEKGIYSTRALINKAENALASEVVESISGEAKKDLNQAGRCLAFNIPTASGYHALRATEKVLREYCALVLKKPTDDLRMKQAIDELVKANADAKTMAVLDQLRYLHRNPLDHPDVFLTLPEAMELFNICTGAISAVARQIAKIKVPQL